jgi:predicted TIM-barrel fold metal-dependent hydrolase
VTAVGIHAAERARSDGPVVDFHAHFWPMAYLDALASAGLDPSYQRKQSWASDDPRDVRGRLAMMDAAGVDLQILSPGGPMPYLADAAAAARCARLANDLYRGLAKAHPGRFGAFALLPLPHVDAAVAEACRCLDELDVAGIGIGTSVLGRTIADERYADLYAELDRRGSVLYVHPSGVGAGSTLITEHDLIWVVGAPMEDTLAAVHLIFSGVLQRYPNIRVLVSHIGGALPVMLGRLDFLYTDELPKMDVDPSALARRMWYDSVAHGDTLAIEAAVRAFGSDKVVLGSDFPYQLDGAYTDSIGFLSRSRIDPEQAGRIVTTNAAELLGEWLPRNARR